MSVNRYCSGDAILNVLVVHPAYWSRGHASKLVRRATELAKVDGVNMCVSTNSKAQRVYGKAGFKEVAVIDVEGDRESSGEAERLEVRLLEYGHSSPI
jgi:GNAT superfamily N-acetyltransferase